MPRTDAIQQMEAEARALNADSKRGYVKRTVAGREVECEVISSMINRGMATGLCHKTVWKLDGKRASYATVQELVR